MGEAYGGAVRIGSQSVGGRLEEVELRSVYRLFALNWGA